MTDFQVLDPVLLRLSADAGSQSAQDTQETQTLEGVVAVVEANRIGVRLTGSSVGKGNISEKMGDLQCPPKGGIYVHIPTTAKVIRKRPVTRLDELRLRRELGILASSSSSSSSTTSGTTNATTSGNNRTNATTTNIPGASTSIDRSRIRRRQDAAMGESKSTASFSRIKIQRVASADPPESFRLPPPEEISYSSSNNDQSNEKSQVGESSVSDERKATTTKPLHEETTTNPSLEQLQKEIDELPQQVKSTQERLAEIKKQKEQRFQDQKQEQHQQLEQLEQLEESLQEQVEADEPPESQEAPVPNDPDEQVVDTPPSRRSDPPGRTSDAVAIQRLIAWSQSNDDNDHGNNAFTSDMPGSAATSLTAVNSDDTSAAAAEEDFMIGQSVKTPNKQQVAAITELSSTFQSPLEKAEAKNNPDLAKRMDVSNCSSIGQEVSEVSFFLQSNAPALHEGLNGSPVKPNLSTQMESSNQSSADEKSNDDPNNTTQKSSEGMEQVLDPWDRILLQSKGMMEKDKPETVLQAAAPQPVPAISDPWAVPVSTQYSSTSVLDVSNPYGAMAPVPIPVPPPPTPDRLKVKESPTPLRSNTSAAAAKTGSTEPTMGVMMSYFAESKSKQESEKSLQGSQKSASSKTSSIAAPPSLQSNASSTKSNSTAETKSSTERPTGETSETMGVMMSYFAESKQQDSQRSLEGSQKSSNGSQKSAVRPYSSAASAALPSDTTEATFADLLRKSQKRTPLKDAPKTNVSDNGKTTENLQPKQDYAEAASVVLPVHTTETTFSDLFRKQEQTLETNGTNSHQGIQPKSSFDTMVSIGLESVDTRKTLGKNELTAQSGDAGTAAVLDEKKEDDRSQASSRASSKETPFSLLKPLSIGGERRSIAGSKPWSKVLNRLTDEVPEPEFKRAQSAPVEGGLGLVSVDSLSHFSNSKGSPGRSVDSYSTSSLPKPPGLVLSTLDEDPEMCPLDETGVSLGSRSPARGLEFNSLMPLMTALNDDSIKPSFGRTYKVSPPDFDENSLRGNSVSTNGAVRTPKRSPTTIQPATRSPFEIPLVTNGSVSPPPIPPTGGQTFGYSPNSFADRAVSTRLGEPNTIELSPISALETSSITNEGAATTPTPSRPTNAFGSPLKSPLENSIFTNGPMATPTRPPPSNLQKSTSSTHGVFRARSGQENMPAPTRNDQSKSKAKQNGVLDSSDDTVSLLNATGNSVYSHDKEAGKDDESFSSYAWTAPASVNSESKSADNDVFLTGTFDVESQASTPSKMPRITLDDSFSLYSHVGDQQDQSPTFLELDMAGQIKDIVKKTRAKREQTRNETSKFISTSPSSETSKIISISPLKSPNMGGNKEDEDDKKSFVSLSSSEESESLKESAADDEFQLESPPKQTRAYNKNAIRCLAIVFAMTVGAAAAVLFGMGILDLEKGELPSSTVGQDGGTLSPTAPKLVSLADKLEIEEFDMVLAHIQASLEWMVQNDSAEFTDSLNDLELEERFALIALYMGTSSEGESNWKEKGGFLTPDVSVCDWNLGGFGVFCDAEGRVTEIYLDENDMSGVLPKELSRLSMMETLSLSSNRITGSIPASLFTMKHLYSLVLSHNQLTGAIPESRNGALQILNLSHNYKLTGQIPESLTQQTSLKHLALLGTNIGGTIPEFSSESEVELVALADSRIRGSIPSSLPTLPKLRYLYLIENALTGTVPTDFSSQNVLQHLYLSGNELTGGVPSEIQNLRRLRHLGLDFNALVGILPTELATLETLEYLYLNSNVKFEGDLSNPELRPLFSRLKELQIQNTAILLTEDSLCSSDAVTYEWDFVSSDCKPTEDRVTCTCCDVCCPDSAADSNNVCLSFNPSGKSILENTVW
ncbi:unnamed protein product [Cylindrotheca closterium]|uniref:L domain-like protein n=1 Tax=Cylindrotheca closterium TaxID=2856 RepID=A0AAD2FN44_9STRA|nr:unnamed protein product [Cylindrotheca closterium]